MGIASLLLVSIPPAMTGTQRGKSELYRRALEDLFGLEVLGRMQMALRF
jgi:hypothetical protein